MNKIKLTKRNIFDLLEFDQKIWLMSERIECKIINIIRVHLTCHLELTQPLPL